MNWSKLLNANQTFVIDTTVHSEYFNHSICFPKCKDAMLINEEQVSASIDKVHPDLRSTFSLTRSSFCCIR
jgi:putative N6-adenine-specific DNA methylase